VRLTVIGCSPAWPNAGGAQSGYLVEGPDGRLLLDCGPGVLARLRANDGGWPRVDAVAITHFHLDTGATSSRGSSAPPSGRDGTRRSRRCGCRPEERSGCATTATG